jgi:hypothetical protein
VHVIGVPADPGILARLWAAGIHRAVHWLPAGPRDAVECTLERWEAAIAGANGK